MADECDTPGKVDVDIAVTTGTPFMGAGVAWHRVEPASMASGVP